MPCAYEPLRLRFAGWLNPVSLFCENEPLFYRIQGGILGCILTVAFVGEGRSHTPRVKRYPAKFSAPC